MSITGVITHLLSGMSHQVYMHIVVNSLRPGLKCFSANDLQLEAVLVTWTLINQKNREAK